jgi:cellulose synthase (UDP-forming)
MSTPPSRQATTALIAALAIVSLAWYASFLYNPSHIGHPVAYSLLAVAEIISMSQLLGIWGTVIFSPNTANITTTRKRGRIPSIAVFVPVAGEPLAIIQKTVIAARDILGEHRTIILDDGASSDVESLAQTLGVEYLRRPKTDGKKAGNINFGLKKVKTTFFAIFDSDHVAHPDFLKETLPHLIANRKLAFVQTPQFFGNREDFISGGAAEAQEIFYRHIQTGKNLFNAAFCVGTNVIFRRSAIDEIGGLYPHSNSEDIWTSLLLHERGWESLFLPKVLAVGHAPDTLASYFRQQFRWARGGMEILMKRNPLFQSLSLDQKLQYLHTTTHYLTSISLLVFYTLPLLYVYFGWKPINAPEGAWHWASRFLPYYTMMFLTAAHLLGRTPLWRSFVTATTAFPAHIAAIISVITRTNIRWSVTGVIRRQTDYIKSVAPHLLLLLLSLGAIPILITEAQQPLSLMMSFWLLWNSAVLISVCKRAFPRLRTAPKAAPVISYAS